MIKELILIQYKGKLLTQVLLNILHLMIIESRFFRQEEINLEKFFENREIERRKAETEKNILIRQSIFAPPQSVIKVTNHYVLKPLIT